MVKPRKHTNVIGKTYGHLTAVDELDRIYYKGRSKRLFRCKCVCGEIVDRWLVFLVDNNHIHHCGCKNAVHNLSHKPIHRMWCNMKKRCYKVNASGYKYYGGKGVSVCDEWRNNFMCFYGWAVINGHKDGLEIDRINCDGDYEPTNCRFVTRGQNMNNRKYGIRVNLHGAEMSLADACRKLNLFHQFKNIRQRVGTYKWDFEDAIKF